MNQVAGGQVLQPELPRARHPPRAAPGPKPPLILRTRCPMHGLDMGNWAGRRTMWREARGEEGAWSGGWPCAAVSLSSFRSPLRLWKPHSGCAWF
eukprot:1396756-Rhodomonas_salina.4